MRYIHTAPSTVCLIAFPPSPQPGPFLSQQRRRSSAPRRVRGRPILRPRMANGRGALPCDQGFNRSFAVDGREREDISQSCRRHC
jgi:hypothetical protein